MRALVWTPNEEAAYARTGCLEHACAMDVTFWLPRVAAESVWAA